MDNESTLMEQYFNEAEYLAARERVDALSDTPLVDGDAYADYMVNGVAYNINPSNAFDESDFFQAFIDAAAEDDATWEMISVEDLMTFLNENYPGTSGLGYYMNAPELFEEWGVSPVAVAGDEMVEVETSYTISQSATMVAEGDALVITITGSQAADDDVTFAYELSSTEAGASDFASSTSGSVTIPAGETSATITVDIAANDGAEFAEDFSVVISSGGAEVTTINATITDTSSVVPPVVDADQSYTFDENQADEAAVLATVTATDADEDAVAGFEIVGGNDDGFFTINDAGEIMFTEAGLASALNDFEATPDPAVLEIVAIDADGNTSEAVAVTLTVADVDDVAPELSMSTIGMASATLTFSELLDESSVPSPSDFLVTIQGQSTTIGVNTVTVDGNQVILALGQEPADGQTFLVDYTPGTNPLMDMSGMAAVGFDDAELVEDASAPVIEAGQTFSYQEESLAAGDALGDAVAASDDVGVATFEITGGNDDGFFAIDNDGVISLTAAGAAANVASNDFETTPNSFALEITATDAAGNIDVETVTVSVTNDEADDGESFVLTINTDAGAAYTGTDGDDVFYGEENTLTSNDDLDGAAGDADLLRYSSSGAAQVNEAGFTISNIERVQVTGDVTDNGAVLYETVFDVTNTNGVETLINDNSSTGVQFTGAQELFGLELNHVGGNIAGASHTRVDYQAGVVAGTADAQQVLLNDVRSDNGTAAGQLTVNGIETFNIVTEGESSQLTALNSNALQTVNISGDQDLAIDNLIANATTVNAGTFEGNLNIVVDSGANDVVVTAGSGDDRVDFSAGFDNGDSLDGGEGDMDTIVLNNANATGVPAGAIQNTEILEISTPGAGTIDMDNFPGVVNVDYVAGLGGATTVDDAVSGITVEVNVDAVAQNLTVDLKTDATEDVVNFQFDAIGAADNLGTVNADDAETLNIQVNDDAAVAGTGALRIATLSAQNATTLNISGDADLNIANANDPATPVLSSLNATDLSGDLTVAATNFAAGGANIVLGSGDDTLTFAAATGADSITLGDGADTVVYNALAQSDRDMDTITDFVSGTDVVDVRALMGGVGIAAANQFVGNRATFAQAQGALIGDANADGILQTNEIGAVFQQDEQILWVDLDGNGTLDNNDLRVNLSGVGSVTTADLGFVAGVTFTANTVGAFQTNDAINDSVEQLNTTPEADTINATVAQINNAGTIINGNGGADILNVSATAAAGEIVNLTVPAFASVETINIDSSVEGIVLSGLGFAPAVNGIATVAGVSGTNQSLTLAGGDDISGATITNIETLNTAGNVTMNIAQHNAFTNILAPGGADTITFADGVTAAIGDADVETYVLGGTTTNDFTLGAATQNVTAAAAVTASDTVRGGGMALTGAFAGFGGNDTLVVTNGSDLTGANAGAALGFGTLNLTGAVTMTEAQHDVINIAAAGGADAVTIQTGALASIFTDADVETYTIQDDTADDGLFVQINNAAQVINANQLNDVGDVTTFDFGPAATVFTGTITGEGTSNDIMSLGNGDNISGGNIVAVEDLTLSNGSAVTMTTAQWNAFTGTITANATETVTLTTSGAASAEAPVENYVLQGAGVDTFTISETADITLTDAARGAMSVDLAGGGADVLAIDNAAVNNGVDSSVSVTNYSGDQFQLSVAGTSTSDGIFYNNITAAGLGATVAATGDIIEIDSASYQYADATNTAAVLNFVVASGLTSTAATVAPDAYITLIAYNGAGEAAIYQAQEIAVNAGANIELIAVVDVTDNAFIGANFA